MTYDGKLLNRAMQSLEKRNEKYTREIARRQSLLEARFPRLREISEQMRTSVIGAINIALSSGTDAADAVKKQAGYNLSLQEERANILSENGYPSDFLSKKPRCPLCSDTGYIHGGVMCGCLKELYIDEIKKELTGSGLAEKSFDDLELSLFSSQEPAPGGISPRDNIEYIRDTCRDFCTRLPQKQQGLFMRGPAGTGKTFMAACVAYYAAQRCVGVIYESIPSLLLRYEDERFKRDDAGRDVDRPAACDLLILDDLGAEVTTAYTASRLYSLINGRLAAGRACVVITSLSDEELSRKYPKTLTSRFSGEFTLLNFLGDDLRRQRRRNFV